MSFTTRSAAVLVGQTAAPAPGGQLLAQTVAAVNNSVAAVTTGLLFLRTLAAQSAEVAALTAGLFSQLLMQALAAIAITAPAVARTATYLRTLAAQVVTWFGRVYGSDLYGTGIYQGSWILVTYLRTLSAANTNVAALTRIANYLRTLAAQSVAAAALTKLVNYLRTLAVESIIAAAMSRLGSYARTLAAQSIATPSLARIANYLRTLAAQVVTWFMRVYSSDLYGTGVYQGRWIMVTYLRTLPSISIEAASYGKAIFIFKTLAVAMTSALSFTVHLIPAPIQSLLSYMLARTTDLAARFATSDQIKGRRITGAKGQDQFSDTDRSPGRTIAGTDDPSKRKPGKGGLRR